MRCRSWIAACLLALGLLANPMDGVTWADDQDHHHHVRSTQATPHTDRQAGYPQSVSPMAMESYNEHYSGGYVGGGKAMRGHGPCTTKGRGAGITRRSVPCRRGSSSDGPTAATTRAGRVPTGPTGRSRWNTLRKRSTSISPGTNEPRRDHPSFPDPRLTLTGSSWIVEEWPPSSGN